MEAALPLKSLVIIIATGGLLALILIIFAKRQITRFAMKSNSHVAITSGVPKYLRQELERRLKRTTEIMYEPTLLTSATEKSMENTFNGETCHFKYRMKALDAVKKLDLELSRYSPHIRRHPDNNLRLFLLEHKQHGGPLCNVSMEDIDKLANAYEHARHEPAVFLEEQYDRYMRYLNVLIKSVRNKRNEENRGQPSSADSSTNGAGAFDDRDSGIQLTFRAGSSGKRKASGPSGEVLRLTPTSVAGSTAETESAV